MVENSNKYIVYGNASDNYNDDDIDPAIVIDLGSHSIKAGFSGEDTPRVTIPTIIGKPRDPALMIGMVQKEYYTGWDAWNKKHLLTISNPIYEGVVTNFEELQKILEDLANYELKISYEG